MKKIFTYALLAASLGSGMLLTSSCDDLLETKNFTDMSPANFFKTEGDMDAAVTGLYQPCTTNWGYEDGGTGNWHQAVFNADMNSYFVAGMLSTDIVCPYSSNLFDEFNVGPATGGPINNTYNLMRFVARATDVINQIGHSTGATEDIRARFIAESKTLRAIYMFMLFDWFGPVNVKLDPETLESNVIEPRPDEATYVNYIIDDLTDAIETEAFPERYNNDFDNWGRTSKAVAYAYRMRLYMNLKQWDKAKADAQHLMGMGYSLLKNYEDVFNTDCTSEHVWSIPANTATDNYYITEVLPSDFKRGYNLVGDSYIRGNDNEYLSGWQAYCMRWEFYDTFADNDVRKKTILCEYETVDGTHKDRSSMTGAIPLKFTDTQFYNYGIQKAQPIVRYAEVLLSFAEAENELYGPTADAIAAVKLVTDRAGITIPEAAKASKEAFRDFLLEERGRELYCEGQRRQDLIRHGVFISRARERGNNAQDYQVLYPIPDWAIIEAGGILEQNPGYTN